MSETTKTDYLEEAQEDVKDMALEFLEEITQALLDGDLCSWKLLGSSPIDSYLYEEAREFYSLIEAAECLDQLSDYEETDSGLWQNLPPKEAVLVQASYTYKNAIVSFWGGVIEEVKTDGIIADFITEAQETETDPDKDTLEQMVKSVIQAY